MVTIDEMAEALRRRHAGQKARDDARAEAVRARFPAAKRLLVDRFGASRVVLFGSFARGEAGERSDVDLAVAGLRTEDYSPALAELTGLLDSPVDLVELERAGPSLLARIDFEGQEL